MGDTKIFSETPLTSPDSATIFSQLFKPGEYLHTSLGSNYNNATFGRDSIISARELLEINPQVAEDVILRLASFQGTKNRNISGEELGKVHHEHRELDTWNSEGLINRIGKIALSLAWGGNLKEMTTYFSIDSTPLYISLVADYAKLSPEILEKIVTRDDGQKIAVEQSLIEATNWTIGHISNSGLVETRRRNPISIIHQTWKDSLTGYTEEDGKMLNVFKPIAYLNIQAMAANGLSSTADALSKKDTIRFIEWRKAADSIIKSAIDRFWMEDEQFFASAAVRDKDGNYELVKTLQSDPGWLLNTDFFDKLPNDDREKYISGIVKKLFSSDFLTDVGIRCRSLEYADNNKTADYHGSLVSWPVDTYQTAQGLRKQGLPQLASQLEARVLNAVNASGDHYEFYYVMPDGKVVLNPEAAKIKKGSTENLPIEMYPESNIAWTVAATLAIKNRLQNNDISGLGQSAWQLKLENEVLANIKNVSIAKTKDELLIIEQKNTYLDIRKGSSETVKKAIRELGKIALRQIFLD